MVKITYCLFLAAFMVLPAKALQLQGQLVGHEADFQAAGAAYNVDPLFLEAVAIEETGNGTSNALAQHNNPAGLMDPSTPNDTGFYNYSSIAQGINAEAATLQNGYISQGLTTISAIGAKYSPAGAANDPNGTNSGWGNDVAGFYQSLGGTQMAMGTAQPTIGGAGVSAGANNAVENVNIQVVDQLMSKFQNAAKTWSTPLINGASTIFWGLAIISLVWSLGMLLLKRAEIGEIFIELVRYIISTGIFFWFLTNGPQFATAIITSLRQLGGTASGTGQALFPGDLISLSIMVFQGQFRPINLLSPFSGILPSLLALIVLVVSVLIVANMMLVMIAAWVVAYAGVVVLGFGSSRFTSDIAINYFRTALSVGLRLMTMQLVISLGISFLQSLVKEGDITQVGPLIATAIAVIIIAVLSHSLPQMVAGMVQGSGHHGAIGGMGVLGALGAGLALSNMAGRAASGAVGAVGALANAAGIALGASPSQQLASRINGSSGSNGSSGGSSGASSGGIPSNPGSVRPPPVPSSNSRSQPVAVTTTSEQDPFMSPDESRGFEPPSDFTLPDEP